MNKVMVEAGRLVSDDQVLVYEKILATLLGYPSSDALRADFRRSLLHEAANEFPAALDRVRAAGQPDEQALPWAVEAAMIKRLKMHVPTITEILDPKGSAVPSAEVEAKVRAAWEEEAPR